MLEAEDARARAQAKLRQMRKAGISREKRASLHRAFNAGCLALMEGRTQDALAAFEPVIAA